MAVAVVVRLKQWTMYDCPPPGQKTWPFLERWPLVEVRLYRKDTVVEELLCVLLYRFPFSRFSVAETKSCFIKLFYHSFKIFLRF